MAKKKIITIPKDHLFYGLGAKMTDEQYDFRSKILAKDITFCNAIPGSGKTTFAFATAQYLYESQACSGIVYFFNPTEEKTLGFRPGGTKEKELDYIGPLIDAVVSVGLQPDIINKEGSHIEAKSHTFVRGTNLENKIVIIDEAQNWTKKQLRKMLTRIHETCTVIVIGHTGQIDLPKPHLSGFAKYIKHFKDQEKAGVAQLTVDFRGWISQHADKIDDEDDTFVNPFEIILDKVLRGLRLKSKAS